MKKLMLILQTFIFFQQNYLTKTLIHSHIFFEQLIYHYALNRK